MADDEDIENDYLTSNGNLQSSKSILEPPISKSDIFNENVTNPNNEVLSKRQIVIIVLLNISAFAVTSCFALIVPFFPEEAMRRGASNWTIGFILSIYQLAAIVSGFFYGRFSGHLGLKFLIVTGNIILALSTILFGCLNYSPKGNTFIVLCLVVRVFQGLSSSAVVTASFAVVAKLFPGRVTMLVGIMESSTGFAYIVGPVIGGILYELGGFLLPFIVSGIFQLVAGLCCFCFLQSQEAEEYNEIRGTYWKLLKIPQVWLSITSILAITISMAFFDLTIAPHMDKFGLNAAEKGLMMCCISITYVLMGPVWGRIVDKTGWSRGVMAVGAIVNSIGLLMLGPSPLFQIAGSLWLMGVALAIMGLGLGAQVIPPFTHILHLAKSNRFPDDIATIGLVSGLVNSCFPLGAFLGPSVGGFVVEAIGFSWSVTGLAGFNTIVALGITINICFTIKQKKRSEEENVFINEEVIT